MSNSRCQQDHTSSEGCRKNPFLNLTFLWPYPFLGLWQCNSSLCLPPSSCGHFLCVCMSFSVSFVFTFIDVGIIQESACSAGDLGSIPGLERSPGEGNGNPLQYSCLENFMDRGAWRATIYGVTKVKYDWVTNTSLLHTNSVCLLFNL